MLQAQSVVLDLEKLLVERENFGWTSGACRRKTPRGVRQNLLKMTGRSHRKFQLLFNLKLETQNPKFPLAGEEAIGQ